MNTDKPRDATCANCRFSERVQLPPPSIVKALICRWGPPQMVLTQQGLVGVPPQMPDEQFCHRHEPASITAGKPALALV
jgi:hypothetical protein